MAEGEMRDSSPEVVGRVPDDALLALRRGAPEDGLLNEHHRARSRPRLGIGEGSAGLAGHGMLRVVPATLWRQVSAQGGWRVASGGREARQIQGSDVSPYGVGPSDDLHPRVLQQARDEPAAA